MFHSIDSEVLLFKAFQKYTMKLNTNEVPDYKYLINLFEQLMIKNEVTVFGKNAYFFQPRLEIKDKKSSDPKNRDRS